MKKNNFKNVDEKMSQYASQLIIAIGIFLIGFSVFYYLVSFLPNKERNSQKEIVSKKTINQEEFDKCIHNANYEYKISNRNLCWIYNHDAINCDLDWIKKYNLEKEAGELPQEKWKKDLQSCRDKYPAIDRLYSGVSPYFDDILKDLGNYSEREIVSRVIDDFKALDPYMNLEEKYQFRYEVTSPTKQELFWIVHIYKSESSNDENIITIIKQKIDALTGENIPIHDQEVNSFNKKQNNENIAISAVRELPDVEKWLDLFSEDSKSDNVGIPIIEVDHITGLLYVVHAYELRSDHIATFNWYEVNVETKEVNPEF